jgi:hypothetical protein
MALAFIVKVEFTYGGLIECHFDDRVKALHFYRACRVDPQSVFASINYF